MQDGVINIRDPRNNNVEGTVKVHFRRDFPEPVIELCLNCIKKGLEEWQNRVIIMDDSA